MVLLNLDAGEHAAEPDELWALADIVCVACGGHAGDDASMSRVVTFCATRARPVLGAHPSYPDRDGFGRRSQPRLPAAELLASLVEQLAALARIASTHGVPLAYVKPHGALYHDAAADPARAATILDAVATLGTGITLIGPAHGALADAARTRGVAYMREVFADRRTRSDGTLVPRSEPGALITDPASAAARARELVAAGTTDTICCHADTPGALAIVAAVRAALTP